MNIKLGLVLSGGGAKGAYEVGVVKALARFGIEPAVVTGASIGALNGAVVSAAQDIKEASVRLEQLWYRMSAMRAAGSSIREILQSAVTCDVCGGARYRDLYISVYPISPKRDGDGFSSRDSVRDSVFLHVDEYSQHEHIDIIQASMAFPGYFLPVSIRGRRCSDGGIGRFRTAQGNTPVQPLVQSQCTHAIIVLPSDGALWNRYEWRDVIPIEIRPSVQIESQGLLGWCTSLKDFSFETVQKLISQGEEDAFGSISRLGEAYGCILRMKRAGSCMDAARQADAMSQESYEDAIRKSNEYFRGPVEE